MLYICSEEINYLLMHSSLRIKHPRFHLACECAAEDLLLVTNFCFNFIGIVFSMLRETNSCRYIFNEKLVNLVSVTKKCTIILHQEPHRWSEYKLNLMSFNIIINDICINIGPNESRDTSIATFSTILKTQT